MLSGQGEHFRPLNARYLPLSERQLLAGSCPCQRLQ